MNTDRQVGHREREDETREVRCRCIWVQDSCDMSPFETPFTPGVDPNLVPLCVPRKHTIIMDMAGLFRHTGLAEDIRMQQQACSHHDGSGGHDSASRRPALRPALRGWPVGRDEVAVR